MKYERIIPGLILVLLGTVFLLDNYHIIDFRWSNLWHLWPVFLIMSGVNLVFARNRSPLATILKVGVVILGFGVLVFAHTDDSWFPRHYNFHYNEDNDDNDNDDDNNSSDSTGIVKVDGSSSFSEPYTAAAVARLIINGGATLYTLKDTTNQFFEAKTREYYSRFEYYHKMDGAIPTFELKMKEKKGNFEWDTEKNNSAVIKLNPNTEWEINVNTGASKVDFDLSKFKIRKLELNGGAASFDAKFGQPLATTDVEVSASAAGIDLQIPQNAACRIIASTGLSSNDFNGFTQKGNGTYETPGFDSAKNKFIIHINGAFAGFKVTRY
jgi:hypothetical protein